jgi:hypothetical protein
MRNYLLILITYIFLGGCIQQTTPDDTIYYPTGEVREEIYFLNDSSILMKEYYENGNLMSVSSTINERYEGLIMHYYQNGKVKSIGKFHKGKAIGSHSFYSELGNLNVKRNYVIVDTVSHLNEVVYYDEHGEVLNERSNYFTLHSLKDTIDLGEEYRIKIKLDAPYFREKMLVFVGDFDSLFNHQDSLPVRVFTGGNFTVEYKFIPEKKGNGVLRGIISDYAVSEEDTSKMNERLFYFSKEYYVK